MVQTDISSIVYVGNNSPTASYPVPFNFFRDEDLVVIVKDAANVEEIQILNTDYTVTGEGDPNGGAVTFSWAVPATSFVMILRDIDATQLTSYEEADAFPAKSHERALDKLTMLVQQALRVTGGSGPTDLGAAFRLSEASGGINALARINDTTLGLDSAGNAILRTSGEMLGWMGTTTTAWQNTAERINTRGAYAGQVGVQLDNYTIFIAHSTDPGDWLPFIPGSGIVFANDGTPYLVTPPAGDLVGTTESQVLTNKTLENITVSGVSGLTKADVGLGNVDNTSDINKPVSAATSTALSTKQPYSEKGFANGYASLDATGKVPTDQLPAAGGGGGMIYKGSWNAATNTPTIPVAAVGNNGWFYVVSVAGTTNINGITSWAVGDWITSNGSVWQKIPQTDAVSSVNGRTGEVVVNKTDVGLPNVDNTSDATKNSAVATLTNKTIDGGANTLTVRLGNDVTGNLPISRLNNGTGAGAGTFWCGDNSWKAPTGPGDVNGPNGSADGEIPVFSGVTGKLLRRYTGSTGFPKIQQNAAPTVVGTIEGADLGPGAIHNQTQKSSAIVDNDEFLIWDSSVSALRRIAAPLVRHLPGEVVQTKVMEITSELGSQFAYFPLVGGNIIWPDTAGAEVLSTTFAPQYATSKLLFQFSGLVSTHRSPAVLVSWALALFVNGTSTAISKMTSTGYCDNALTPFNYKFWYSPGATTGRTYSYRLGAVNATTVNLILNGYGYTVSGYANVSTLVIQEIKQ